MATPVKYRNGLIGTCLFHGVVLFLLLYMAFRTPLPLPAEQGILVDFGTGNTGKGDFEPRMSDPASVQSQPAESKPQTQPDDQMLTQDAEETVALPSKPKEKPIEKPKEKPKENSQPAVAEQPQPERTVNKRALYPGRGDDASTATSQGEAGGQGNQGVTTGAPDVHVYGPGGDTGGGSGFALSGRTLVGRLPVPEYKSQEQGKVVVDIIVDKEGKVTKASLGKGSTTLDNTLVDAALKAARKAVFSRKPDALEQHGTITYIFKVQGE